MSAQVLTVEGVTKAFALPGDRELEVLREVNFWLGQGESVSIQGESGSGKSTLLNCLAGLEEADGGSIHWHPEGGSSFDIVGASDGRLAAVRAGFLGFVFQSHFLVPELNLLENVLLPSRFLPNRKGSRERGLELLDRVGLADRAKGRVEVLSGGERQRVAVARSLMNQPKLIFADEPTGNLDEKTSESVIDLLLEACRDEGVALVLVTHNSGHAQRTERAMVLQKGVLDPAS